MAKQDDLETEQRLGAVLNKLLHARLVHETDAHFAFLFRLSRYGKWATGIYANLKTDQRLLLLQVCAMFHVAS